MKHTHPKSAPEVPNTIFFMGGGAEKALFLSLRDENPNSETAGKLDLDSFVSTHCNTPDANPLTLLPILQLPVVGVKG